MSLTRADAAHLARRTGFGATPDRVRWLMGAGTRAAAVDQVMDLGSNPTDALSPAISALLPSVNGPQVDLLQLWWLERMVTSPTPLLEKLTLFWHGHFATAQDKVQDISLLYGQNTTIRRLALGSFHDLAQAMSIDPAMMYYLDNHANISANVQENFGRELLEAFTVGPAASDETDVLAMSRAWTGHGLDLLGRTYEFHPAHHDDAPKVLFGLPPRNWDGPAALSETLLGHGADASSRFIVAKLFSFLAYSVTPGDEVVDRLATVYRRSDLSIRALVEAILRSEEFWSPAARHALVRSPIEWVVSLLQATGVAPALGDPIGVLRRLGQEPFSPPNVFGWRGQGGWVSSAAVWAKAQWAQALGARAATLGFDAGLGGAPSDAAGRAMARFGLADSSATTFRRVADWIDGASVLRSTDPVQVTAQLVQLLALTPEAQVA